MFCQISDDIAGILQAVLRNTLLILAVGLVGCSNKIDPSFVAERWATTLSAFNIDAVFPPRFMQPGDVYLVMEPAERAIDDKNRYKRRSVRLGRAEVRQILMEDAKRELLLPDTSNSNPKINVFNVPERVVRLRPMGFTGFNIANITEADIGAAAPIQAIRALFGFAGGQTLVMSISIPNAEFIELPAIEAYDALVGFCSPEGPPQDICSINDEKIQFAMANLRLPDDQPGMKLTPKIVIVTHVYYARQIDYAYTTKGGAALAISAALAATPKESSSSSGTKSSTASGAAPSAAGAATPATPGASGSPASGTTTTSTTTTTTTTTTVGSSSGSAGAGAGSSGAASSGAATGAKGVTPAPNSAGAAAQSGAEQEKAALEARLEAIRKQLGAAGPAGSLHVLSTSSEGTILRQTFDVPVAIGYRGLSMIPTISIWQTNSGADSSATPNP